MKEQGKVLSYTTASAIIKVNFPENRVVCKFCPFCVSDYRNRKRECCFLTEELLVFDDLTLGNNCPLVIIEEEV